jgi:hypothetical protein
VNKRNYSTSRLKNLALAVLTCLAISGTGCTTRITEHQPIDKKEFYKKYHRTGIVIMDYGPKGEIYSIDDQEYYKKYFRKNSKNNESEEK